MTILPGSARPPEPRGIMARLSLRPSCFFFPGNNLTKVTHPPWIPTELLHCVLSFRLWTVTCVLSQRLEDDGELCSMASHEMIRPCFLETRHTRWAGSADRREFGQKPD
ncbi:hypothetical protein AcV5_002828 [Taiwanofungus camphoratus]|nr:hypothetical protein AcV5_002828 [Antrodia cinnamomea]